MRGRFGVSLWGAGVAYPLGEAVRLATAALGDPSTQLGAAEAGWAYPAAVAEVLMLAATVGEKAFRKLAPWRFGEGQRPAASQVEVDQAQSELDSMVHFG